MCVCVCVHCLAWLVVCVCVFVCKGYKEEHDLMMLDSTGKAQHGNADENHAAGQDASNNRQVRDNGRGPCIDADANQQETNHLKNNAKTETERSK